MTSTNAPRGPSWRDATVLLVENEPVMRTLLSRRLESEGFTSKSPGTASPQWHSSRAASSPSIWS